MSEWLLSQRDDNGPDFGPLRGDAYVAALDFVNRVLVPASSIHEGTIVIKQSAIRALGHLIAALPDNAVSTLCDQADETPDQKSWFPPPASAWGAA